MLIWLSKILQRLGCQQETLGGSRYGTDLDIFKNRMFLSKGVLEMNIREKRSQNAERFLLRLQSDKNVLRGLAKVAAFVGDGRVQPAMILKPLAKA